MLQSYNDLIKQMKDFDENGDGIITREEVRTAMTKVMEQGIDEQLDCSIKELSSDGVFTPELSFVIFQNGIQSMGIHSESPEYAELKVENIKTREDVKKAFCKLSMVLVDLMLNAMLTQLDPNNDGQLDVFGN